MKLLKVLKKIFDRDSKNSKFLLEHKRNMGLFDTHLEGVRVRGKKRKQAKKGKSKKQLRRETKK